MTVGMQRSCVDKVVKSWYTEIIHLRGTRLNVGLAKGMRMH